MNVRVSVYLCLCVSALIGSVLLGCHVVPPSARSAVRYPTAHHIEVTVVRKDVSAIAVSVSGEMTRVVSIPADDAYFTSLVTLNATFVDYLQAHPARDQSALTIVLTTGGPETGIELRYPEASGRMHSRRAPVPAAELERTRHLLETALAPHLQP